MYLCIHLFINRFFLFIFILLYLSISSLLWYFLQEGEIYLEFLCYYNISVHILFILFDFVHNWFHFSLSLSPFYYFGYYYFTSVLFHMFSFIKNALFGSYSWMPIGPSLKVVQLRRLFDWSNIVAALPQFFGAARHPCIEVSGRYPLMILINQSRNHRYPLINRLSTRRPRQSRLVLDRSIQNWSRDSSTVLWSVPGIRFCNLQLCFDTLLFPGLKWYGLGD